MDIPINEVRVTTTVARVLRQFLNDPTETRHGFDLMRATGLSSGTLYVILAGLQTAGWLSSIQEDLDSHSAGRPARRMYRLTGDGERAAQKELAVLSEQLQPRMRPSARPRLQGGHT